jgi:ABC-type Mn2+/Zn2+ transport system ATPase subunit
LPQAGIVGIIGPNGAGKSTIFKMIMSKKPDSGEFSIGDTVKSLMLIKRIPINPDKSIWENFADGQN